MNQRIGTYISQTVAGEPFKAYVPPKLPPKPPLDLVKLYPYLEKATLELAKLNASCKSIPNPSLFIYMYVRKEALLSSQIEGTQSSLSDLMLFEHHQKPKVDLTPFQRTLSLINLRESKRCQDEKENGQTISSRGSEISTVVTAAIC